MLIAVVLTAPAQVHGRDGSGVAGRASAAERAGGVDQPRELWITIATRDVEALQQSTVYDDWAGTLQTYESHEGVTLALVREDRLDALTRAMHGRFRRCGGFMVHASREAALDALYFRPEMAAPAPEVVYTIDNGPVVQGLIAEIQAANIVGTINQLAGNATRYYTSGGGVNAANQLKAQWESYAAGRSDVTVELFTHPSWPQPSVIASITGTTFPSEVVVIGGHLDSINSSNPPSGTAPGADDDASGVASLGEAFRAAMVKDYHPQRTVKFMAYAAEEVGLRGSNEIATSYQNAGVNVVGVLQLDMTLYKGSTPDIVMITDNTNAAQNAFVQQLVDTYLALPRSTTACGYACSDHASWHSKGFAASFPFEALFGQYNPFIHTANDTLANSGGTASHALKFSRLTAAYLAELAKGGFGGGDTTPPTTSITSPAPGASVSGTITVAASAVDNVGVTRVEFYLDSALQATDTTSPYSFAWNTTTVANGGHTLTSRAYDAANNVGASAPVGVTVNNPTAGNAVYDAVLRAPKCGAVGGSCDSGPTLLQGRDSMSGGAEPNQPNTINNSCADGTAGTFHADESNDRVKVSTLDGTDLAPGKTVRVEATVWAWAGSPASDKLDLYYAANAGAPAWTLIATLTPTVGGAQVLSANYTLPSGGLQAVRARFRYGGSAAPCGAGVYDDHDDLVFAVGGAAPPPDLTASYDATLKAPKCATVGRSCDSGASLLLGRDGKGPEPNQPNTINNSCADGTAGTFHADESNDRVKVSTLDGTALAAGKTVRVEATVWAWAGSPASDKLDLYYAANAGAPAWTFIATLTPAAGGSQVLSATYTLPPGALQAVRAQFRYSGSASPCTAGGYNDRDDLVFAVQ